MFNFSTLKTGFSGLIGFRNPKDPDIPGFASLTSTSSGLYMDDFHPMVNTDYLEAIAPDFDGLGYDSYSATATYSAGDVVMSSGIAWQCIATANAVTPVAGAYWKTSFENWLDEKYYSALNKLFARFQTHKKVIQNTKSYIDNIQLFDGTSRNSDTITASGRFVGFEIELKKYNNITAVVDRIGLRFTQPQTNLVLYLFHSSKNTAIATATVSTSTGYDFEWKTPTNWELPYVDYTNNIDSGGKWYIGYFESGITGNAINKNYDFSTAPCVGCNGNEDYYFNLWSKYLKIRPIEVLSSNLNGTDLFDVSTVGYTWTQNYGLNVAFSVKTDFTQMAVNNKTLFIDPLGKQFAVDMLETMAYSGNTRINTRAANGEMMALQALAGTEGVKGLGEQLQESINALAEDFAGVSPVLPKERQGMRRGAI